MELLFFEDLVKKGFNKTTIFNEIVKLEKEFFPKYHYNVKDIEKFYLQSNGYTLILLDKNKIAGYLIPILFKNKDYLQLLTIAVSKKYQKIGYGTKMLKRCEEISKMLRLHRIIIRADVSYPILKTLKNLKYMPMELEEINELVKEGIFSAEDNIKNTISNPKIANLLPKAYIITKDIGKKNPYLFVPMIKNIK